MKDDSAHQAIVKDYFRTTSAVGSAATQESFDASVVGLRRRLKPWLDLGNKDVLDLGSGTGELCRLAEDEGAASVVGVNLSAEEIEYALTQTDAQFVHKDIASYLEQCPPASVDRIFALNILEHLDKDTLRQVLENGFRVLRDGGQLIAMVPNATSPFGTMTRYWDITHCLAFTPSSLMQLGRLVGFGEALEFRECGPVPYGIVSSIRFALWQLIRLGIRSYLMIELASAKGGVYTADLLVRFTKPVAK
jgi:SAM-dependent methyltransferase